MKILPPLLAVGMLLGICSPSFADGKAFFKGVDFSSFRPLLEDEQRAIIVHHEGVEKMLIAVSLKLEEQDNALWIFPVLGTPDQVKLDVLDSFPTFRGKDPRVIARDRILALAFVISSTQIYPIIPGICMPILGRAGSAGAYIHEEIEKWGIHAETVTVDSVESLSEYLSQKKNTKIEEEELDAFKDYLSDKYVLVLVWISSRDELLKEFPDYNKGETITRNRWPCLYVEFPTDRPFYPLRPTNTYGDVSIPVRLTIVGFVKPQTNSDLAEKLKLSYYEQESFPRDAPQKLVEGIPSERIPYTTVSFSGTAKELTDDLWFSATNPRGMRYAKVILVVMANWYVLVCLTLVFIATISYVSAGLTGVLLFGKWKGYAQLGLWNVLTIVALFFSIRHLKGPIGERLRNPEKARGKRLFLLVFSLFYILITIAFGNLLNLPLY